MSDKDVYECKFVSDSLQRSQVFYLEMGRFQFFTNFDFDFDSSIE